MTDQIVVSYSELDTFRQCPLKHRLSYRERWRKPNEAGGALARGTLWHQVMQAHYEKLMELQGGPTRHKRPRPSQRPDWLQACRVAVAPLLCNPNTGEQTGDQELIAWMYEGYLSQWGLDAGGPDANNWQILGVEIADVMPMPLPGGTPSSRFALKTKIDLVVKDLADGQIDIVDHKSGRDLPHDRDLDLDDQFGLYQLMLRVNRGVKARGTIHNAARTQRNKGPMALADRFARTCMRRSDEELREIARDALAAAVAAYRKPHKLGTYSSPNPQQCFTGDTLLRPIGRLERITRRWYVGQVATIRTRRGYEFTGTVQHPVLTPQGWVPLGQLRQGSCVVRHDWSHPVSSRQLDNKQGYVKASELFDTAQGVHQRTRGTVYLHGEVIADQKVDIVTVDGSLPPVRNATLVQPGGKLVLSNPNGSPGDPGLPALGLGEELLFGGRGQGSPSSTREGNALLGSPTGGTKSVGFLGRAGAEASSAQVSVDRAAAYAKRYRQGQHRFPVLEPSDEILSIVVREFSGHVYNLQTGSGTYAVHGSIGLNCAWRCDFRDAHLLNRKGVPFSATLPQHGFEQDFTRH